MARLGSRPGFLTGSGIGILCALGFLWIDDYKTKTDIALRRSVEPRFDFQLEHAECKRSEDPFGLSCDGAQPLPWNHDQKRYLVSLTGIEQHRLQALGPFLQHKDSESLALALLRLERLLANHAKSPSLWNDYGAAMLLRRRAGGAGLDLFEALNALEYAIELDPHHLQAHFNLALTLQDLGLRRAAGRILTQVSSLENDRGWSREIEDRLRQLLYQDDTHTQWQKLLPSLPSLKAQKASRLVQRFPWRSHRWLIETHFPLMASASLRGEDTEGLLSLPREIAGRLAERGDSLALDTLQSWPRPEEQDHLEAIKAVGKGLTLLEKLEVERAQQAFSSALPILRQESSPLAWSAELGRVVADYFVDSEAALRGARNITSVMSSRYPALLGRAWWIAGTLEGRKGEYVASRRAYRQAIQILEPVFGINPTGYLRILGGEVSTLDGRLQETWNLFAEGLPQVLEYGSPRRVHSTLLTVGLALQEIGLERAARRVFQEAVFNARTWGSSYAEASARLRLATAQQALEDHRSTSSNIKEAWAATEAISDTILRELTQADLVVAETALMASRANSIPQLRLQLPRLSEAVELFRQSNSSYDEARALLQLAEAQFVLEEDPLPALEQAARLLAESNAAPIDQPGAVGPGLAEKIATRKANYLALADRPEIALYNAERSFLLASGFDSEPKVDLLARLRELVVEQDAAVITIQDGLEAIVWILSPEGLTMHRRSVSSMQIRDQAQVLRRVPGQKRRKILNRIASELLPSSLPKVSRYAFVLGPDLAALPLAALPHPILGKTLLEVGSVGKAPALSFLLPSPVSIETASPLIVAAPTSRFYDDLPGAQEEASFAAEQLPGSTLLVSPAPNEILQRLQKATIFHYSGHLRINPVVPFQQELLLGNAEGNLPSKAILGLDLKALRLVVLASCDSALANSGKHLGPSYSDMFLLSGANAVIGTLWPVDDGSSRQMMMDLWRAISSGALPIDALRQAMLRAQIRDDKIKDKLAPTWMAYQIEGGVFTP